MIEATAPSMPTPDVLRGMPIERRVLYFSSNKIGSEILKARTRYAALQSGKITPAFPSEAAQVANEIMTLSLRGTSLRRDSACANLDEVDARLVEVDREIARLPQTGGNDYTRSGLLIRKEILAKRAEFIRKNGPIIRIMERRRWKAKEEFSGQALPPEQWEQLSPRLIENPDSNLSEQEEYNWYIQGLSSQKRSEVTSLRKQMKPIDDQVRAVVCMPAYKEGKNIYRTLKNYVGQTELDRKTKFDYRKARIVVFNNWPDGTAPDNTESEIARFMKEHPEVPVDYIKASMGDSAKPIANIRNIMTAAVIENAAINRRKPTGDLIYISNDADMPDNALRPMYLADTIREFDRYPKMDAMAGGIDFPEDLMAKVPVQLATRRLWQYISAIQNHKRHRDPYMVGRNSAARLKMIAAVGNYDPKDTSGEDVEIGNKIKWIRSWEKANRRYNRDRIKRSGGPGHPEHRVRYVHRISVDSDPRRDLVRLLRKEPIGSQYFVFAKQQGVRGTTGEELTEEAIKQGYGFFDRNQFENEAAFFYYDSARLQRLPSFSRAMGLVGAKWEVRNGRFRLTDTKVLEKNIQELRFRELYKPKIEQWLKKKISRIDVNRSGENNQVFNVVTDSGERLTIRISGQKDRNKFGAEKWAIDQLKGKGVRVPELVALDTDKKVLPGYSISVAKSIPGSAFRRKYSDDHVDSEILRQYGSSLRAIHSVPITKGYGFLNEKGEGGSTSWEEFILKPFEKTRYEKLVQKGVIDQKDIEEAISLVRSRRPILRGVSRQLLQGDTTLGNVLHVNNAITGVLDFENAKSGDPLWDIANFMVVEKARIGKNGLKNLLTGYGNTKLLDDPLNRSRYQMYKLTNILRGLEWYQYRPGNEEDISWLRYQLKETLYEMKNATPIPGQASSEKLDKNGIRPINRSDIDRLLESRFKGAVDWFKNFYTKGVPNDKEFLTGADVYRKIKPVFDAALPKGDAAAVSMLMRILKSDAEISTSGFSDTELTRQVQRLISVYRTNSAVFKDINTKNPAFRLIMFLRNRGKLSRYINEYKNLPSSVNFMSIATNLAQQKRAKGEQMNILDEGGTLDVAIQQLAGAINYNVPGIRMKLTSTAADNMAAEFSDCHRFPVDHRMADVHKLNQTFAGEKRTLIISQAAYKFFWDPLGAMVQSANALEKGGWAFLGDIRDKPSYPLFKMFVDQDGNPINPQRFFEYLNSLNLGYKFYTGMHTSMRDGEPRQVMTLAIHKDTDSNINIPVYYGKREGQQTDWMSPITYVTTPKQTATSGLLGFTKIT